MKEENDIRLTRYFRKLRKRIDPLNIALREGKLDKAFILAMEIEEEAHKFQDRLNRLKYANHPS